MMTLTALPRLSFLLASVTILAACGDSNEAREGFAENGAAVAGSGPLDAGTRLAAATDRSWINLRGTVVTTTPNSFVLDYGEDTVTVEMDDWDWYREGQALAAGDPVFVTGRVDNDLWGAKRIEASSVYAENLNTYFYASGADEEDLVTSTVYVAPSPTSSDSTGYVTAIEGQEFNIGTGLAAIRVDTSSLSANKKPAVKVGDRVYVWGDLDLGSQERAEIMARGIVLLAKDKTKISGSGSQGRGSAQGQVSSSDGKMAEAAAESGNSQANAATARP